MQTQPQYQPLWSFPLSVFHVHNVFVNVDGQRLQTRRPRNKLRIESQSPLLVSPMISMYSSTVCTSNVAERSRVANTLYTVHYPRRGGFPREGDHRTLVQPATPLGSQPACVTSRLHSNTVPGEQRRFLRKHGVVSALKSLSINIRTYGSLRPHERLLSG